MEHVLYVTHPMIVCAVYFAAANYYLHYVLDCQIEMVGEGTSDRLYY